MNEPLTHVAALPFVLDLDDLVKVSKYKPATLYAAVRRGELKAFRVGNALRFLGTDVAEWLTRTPARTARGKATRPDNFNHTRASGRGE